MDVRYHLLGPIAPSAEMISEFRVASVGNSAAYSQMGDVAIITKSGANEALLVSPKCAIRRRTLW